VSESIQEYIACPTWCDTPSQCPISFLSSGNDALYIYHTGWYQWKTAYPDMSGASPFTISCGAQPLEAGCWFGVRFHIFNVRMQQ